MKIDKKTIIDNFELKIAPKNHSLPAEINNEIRKHRELALYYLIQEEMHYYDELFDAFKAKQPVRSKTSGKTYFIHEIHSFMEWETYKVQTRYILKKDIHDLENMVSCQQGELEIIKE